MQAYVLIIVATMCWGANTVFALMAVGEVSPLFIVSARWFGAALLIAAFTYQQIKRDWSVLKQHWKFILMMGASGFTLFNGFYYMAAHTTTAINLGIIQGAIPIFVLLGSLVLLRVTITKLQIVGILVTIIGVLVVTSKGQLQLLLTLAFSWGDILMLIACFFYAIYTLGLKYRPDISGWSLLFAFAVAAFLVSVPVSLAEFSLGYAQLPTVKGWGIIAMITLLPSLLGQVAFIKGVQMIGPERASAFVNLVPIFAALFAVLFVGEVFHLYHAMALTLVLGGIGISELGKPKKET